MSPKTIVTRKQFPLDKRIHRNQEINVSLLRDDCKMIMKCMLDLYEITKITIMTLRDYQFITLA